MKKIIDAFADDPEVSYGGKGFGASALKVNGKIFAMTSARGQFVVKLPRERVAELVRAGKGELFDTGGGRKMKEWLATDAPSLPLAREALRYVRGGKP
jgi:hypothetical protein